MNIQPDFSEFLLLLEKYDVDYMIVGGYAVAIHGYPRFTKDLDVFYQNSADNIIRIKKALLEFGFPEDQLNDELFSEVGTVLQFGYPPCQIDLLNKITGVEYRDAANHAITSHYGDTVIRVIGKQELLKNKSSTDRQKDKVDVEEINKVAGEE